MGPSFATNFQSGLRQPQPPCSGFRRRGLQLSVLLLLSLVLWCCTTVIDRMLVLLDTVASVLGRLAMVVWYEVLIALFKRMLEGLWRMREATEPKAAKTLRKLDAPRAWPMPIVLR